MKQSQQFLVVLVVSTVLSNHSMAAAPELADSSQSRITETMVTQTDALKSLAGYWSLSVEEYQRYLDIMRGPLGKWNPAIDPLLTLGMFTESQVDQQRYAEMYARQEFELTERTLRFQEAYRAAFQRMYPDVPLIEQRLLTPYFVYQQFKTSTKAAHRLAKRQLQDGDRLLVFVEVSCDHCVAVINRLMGLAQAVSNSGVDLYVLNASGDTAVRRWAKAHQINAAKLKTGQLTLNRDDGLLQRLRARSSASIEPAMPVYLSRGGQYFQLSTQEYGL